MIDFDFYFYKHSLPFARVPGIDTCFFFFHSFCVVCWCLKGLVVAVISRNLPARGHPVDVVCIHFGVCVCMCGIMYDLRSLCWCLLKVVFLVWRLKPAHYSLLLEVVDVACRVWGSLFWACAIYYSVIHRLYRMIKLVFRDTGWLYHQRFWAILYRTSANGFKSHLYHWYFSVVSVLCLYFYCCQIYFLNTP